MKSIFTNLGKLLLCGVVVAMVGCTDFKEDIRVVDEKVNSLTESTTADKATLTQTLDALKKDVTDNYYTKQQIDAVQDALEKSISDEVKGIEDQIKGLNDAITAATNAATAAIADLDGKKADKATVEAAQKKAEDAIAALQKALEGVQTTHSADIKKLEDQIAAAKKDLEGKVGANTTAITALEGQVKTLGAQILELQNMAMSMGIQLQEDMNAIAAELGEEIDAVDAKALELKNDLVALTDHLNEYEQTTDLKLTELNGSLQALSVYLEEYEKEIDLKLTELHGSLQALSVYLAENMVTGEDFAFKMAEVDGAITALNNLLSDLGEKHDKDINEVYAEISKRFDETNGALTTVLELIDGLAAEDQTIYNELNLTKEMLTTVYKDQLALSGEVSTIKATLDARKEAAEAFKAEYDKKIAELEAEDKTNTDLIHSIGTALDSYVEDINAELELVNAEFTKVREEMTQMLNLLTDAHQADMDELWKELNDRKEVTDGAITALNNLVGELQKEDENIYVEINYVKEFATKNLADINALKATVETLEATVVLIEDFKNWEAGHNEVHNNLITMINGINTYIDEELEEIKADAAYDRKQCQETATALNNLIEDVAGDLAKLRAELDDKFKVLDDVIESLEDRLNERIGALEEEVGQIKVDVEAIKTNLNALGEALGKAEKEFAAADKKFASDIAGLRQLCKDQEDNIGKNQTDIYNNAQDIAKIYVELDKINLELADNAEWQGSVTMTLQQLQTQLLDLIGFASEEIAKLQGQIDGIKIDVDAIKTNLKELGEALDKAEKELAAADKKFASDIAGLRQLCKDQEDNIGKNQTDIYNNAQDIAKIFIALAEINAELADNAEWQTSLNKSLEQSLEQLWSAIGLAESTLTDKIETAAGLLKDEDAKIRKELEDGLADVLNKAFKNDEGVMDNVRAFEQKVMGLIDDLQGQIDGIKIDVEAIKTNLNALGETLDKAKKEFAAADEKFASDIAGLRQLCKDQEDNIGLNQTNIYNNAQDIAKIYVKLHKINLELADNAEWQGSVTKTLQQLQTQLLDLIGFASEEIEKLQGQIDDLVNRVQSLVFVPKYSDNLAYMEYARIMIDRKNQPNQQREEFFFEGYTELTYKVNAKEAAAVAEALALSWENNPETFDYDVTDVKTRGASKTGADLEIVKVTAEDQYITVTVKPIAFDDEDFWAASHDDDDGIYSASLVISDSEKNNFRATEYVNLVPEAKARADKFEPVLYRLGGENPWISNNTENYFGPDVVDPAFAPEFKAGYNYYIPANDTEMRKQIIRADFGFEDAEGNIVTPEKLAESYNIGDVTFFTKFDNGQFIGAAVGGTVVCEDSQIAFTMAAEDLWEAHVTEDCVWDLVGESCDFQYCYIWNGLQFTLTHIVEVSNAIINIYVGDKTDETTGEVYTELPWTVALAESLYDGANFAKNLVIEDVPYTGVPDLKLALKNIVNTSMFTKVDGNWTAMGGNIIGLPSYGDGVVDVRLAGGKYSWNNEYKIVWTSVDNTQHIDATVTAIVKLTGKPEKIDVNIENVDYKLVKDTDYFQGAIDLKAASYAAIESYLGYADANADKWTAEFATLRAAYNNGDFGTPEVNEAAGKSENLANLDKAARLYPADDAINYGADNTTTLTVEPWFDVPVNFTVTGTANKPSNALIFSEDHVEIVDPDNGKVQVYGQVGEDGKYSIILSDLAKYFNVDGELNHNMKVKFEVTDPAIEAQVKLIDKDGNASAKETPVLAKTVGTYNYLVDGNVILDWYEYNATEVPVRATLIAEDLVELGSLDLVLWTLDPLDLLAKEGTADSEGRVIVNVDRYPRTATIVPVYKNLVIRGLLEGPEVNLLDPEAASLANVFDKSNAPHTYGAKLDIEMAMQSVYYYKDDATTTPTYIDINKYTYDPVSGILVLKGDDGSLRRPIIADFNLKLSHRICDGKDKLVAVRVIFNHVPNIEEQETITAGTYGFDPTELLAEGYVAVKNGEVWHVVPEADVVPEGFDAAAKDGKELETAIKENKDVLLIDDAKIDTPAESNAYGKTGLNVNNGQTIDGNGNTLEVSGANGTWDSGISTTGGLIQNITVKGAFRGIFINHNSSHSETVILKNVILEDVTYTISCDQGLNQNLEAYNSTFKGWTSYAATIGKVSFTDCYFGEGNGYAFCRPYAPTSFVRCEFEAGFQIDAKAAVTFEDCTLNGVALTAENLATLVTSSSIANATVK